MASLDVYHSLLNHSINNIYRYVCLCGEEKNKPFSQLSGQLLCRTASGTTGPTALGLCRHNLNHKPLGLGEVGDNHVCVDKLRWLLRSLEEVAPFEITIFLYTHRWHNIQVLPGLLKSEESWVVLFSFLEALIPGTRQFTWLCDVS